MTDKTKFYISAFVFMAMASIMFIPTGENGEWQFSDYFHAFFTVPMTGGWFWFYYKKV